MIESIGFTPLARGHRAGVGHPQAAHAVDLAVRVRHARRGRWPMRHELIWCAVNSRTRFEAIGRALSAVEVGLEGPAPSTQSSGGVTRGTIRSRAGGPVEPGQLEGREAEQLPLLRRRARSGR